MFSWTDIALIVMVIAYLMAVAWYARGAILAKKKKYESERTYHRRKENEKRKKRSGRRCPDCKNIIDRRRSVCQHCGHQFDVIPGAQKHPDEISLHPEDEK